MGKEMTFSILSHLSRLTNFKETDILLFKSGIKSKQYCCFQNETKDLNFSFELRSGLDYVFHFRIFIFFKLIK